jgi:hypothetical protein
LAFLTYPPPENVVVASSFAGIQIPSRATLPHQPTSTTPHRDSTHAGGSFVGDANYMKNSEPLSRPKTIYSKEKPIYLLDESSA